MVKIRLKRMGAHKKPFYRIVVADSRSARNGRFIEEIGYYDPLKEPPVIKVDTERAEYWLSQGAQPTDVVRALIKKAASAAPKAAPKATEEVAEDAAEVAEEAVEEVAEEAVEEVAEETTEAVEEVAEETTEAVEEAVEEDK